ncbi:alpha-amylase family glycosyl hydrolase [Halogeometricum limi]|uniref:Glycosidase n=1 Tax=Halogeometricum limi TaxID=555875 RepID=A0A1I6G1D5_9EURY|nr:alpha-amylase family glycosyl hydrolase [Halogeometricum limi]SFR36004.1 Glycosidase [Halogeometricum limi]
MHHPGPPRFTAVGDAVELAPRDPSPEETYRWRVTDRPDGSEATVGDAPVVHLAPDVPGIYRVELDAPDGTHRQTVRAFPDVRTETEFRVGADEVDVDSDDVDSVSVIGPFNDFTMGLTRPTFDGEAWTVPVSLPPGDHDAIFAFDDGFDSYANTSVTVDGPGRPRLRLDGTREGEEVVVTATADAAPDGDDPAVEFFLDGRDGLREEDAAVDGDELRLPLSALSESETTRLHAVPVAERHGLSDTLELSRDGDAVTFSRPADAPAWVEDATVYQIFVREFAGETVDTTFEEISRRIPYLEHLGVDTLWLTPVCASPTHHGYHVTDLFDTADDLGTRAEFESLVSDLHDAGIRVLFDLVINHTSRDHPAYQLHEAGVPGYEDLYERVPDSHDTSDIDWSADGTPGVYFNWWMIPNLNYDSLRVREWMLDVVDEWAPLVDGFRCDVAWGVPHGFWKEVRERVKADDSEFLLLDETVPRRPEFRENEFDLHYDTDLYFALRDVGTGEKSAAAVFDALDASERLGYPDDAVHMRYVENHDEDRYLDECGADALRAAVATTFTLPGTPLIYYGQERGVTEQRGTMRWHDGDADLTDFHRRLVSLRRAEPALRRGTVERVDCSVGGDDDGDRDRDDDDGDAADESRVAAYERTTAEDRLLVVVNFGSEAATVSFDDGETAALADATDLLSGTDVGTDEGVRVADAVVLRLD